MYMHAYTMRKIVGTISCLIIILSGILYRTIMCKPPYIILGLCILVLVAVRVLITLLVLTVLFAWCISAMPFIHLHLHNIM